jgi:ABC-2 type transport system permease protein
MTTLTDTPPSGPGRDRGTDLDPDTELAPRTGVAKGLADTSAVFTREALLMVRDPFSLIFSLIQPLVFLGLFGPLLEGMVAGQGISGDTALQWFLPGVLVMIALFGTSMTGSNLLFELTTGSYERILATPISRWSILVGRSLKEFAPLVVQALLITVICIPFGFELYPLHAFTGLVLLGVFGIGLGALSYALALASKSREWLFWGVQQTLIFPLLILSGMMLPLETGPDWMQTVAKLNPLTYIVDAERLLFAGTFADPVVLQGFAAAVTTCVVGLWVGIAKVRRTV